jgi:hypothetical protein
MECETVCYCKSRVNCSVLIITETSREIILVKAVLPLLTDSYHKEVKGVKSKLPFRCRYGYVHGLVHSGIHFVCCYIPSFSIYQTASGMCINRGGPCLLRDILSVILYSDTIPKLLYLMTRIRCTVSLRLMGGQYSNARRRLTSCREKQIPFIVLDKEILLITLV